MLPVKEGSLFGLVIILLLVRPVWVMPARFQNGSMTPTVEVEQVILSAPAGGEAVQGVAEVMGFTQVPGFVSAEVSFGYQNDPTHTWFLLNTSQIPITQGTLASWDTTTISDGIYRLRLVVFLKDGSTQEAIQEGVRVRNYSPIETSTPALPTPIIEDQTGQVEEAVLPTETPTATPLPQFQPSLQTPLLQPPNPIEINTGDLQSSITRGALIGVGFLLVVGLYLGLKYLMKR